MRHTGAYRMGTRTLALLMAVLMMLTTGGFTLRDSAAPVTDPVAEVTAEPVSEPVPEEPAPVEPAPAEPAPAEPVPETPVPETPVPETPVPETPVPETPVPETEVTAEPVPAEPQGDDMQMGEAEPAPEEPAVEPTAEPAAEPTVEPTVTPEPTADPNAGIMTVAETAGPKIEVTLTPVEGNKYTDGETVQYTLIVKNIGTADLTGGKSDATLKITINGASDLKEVTPSGSGVTAGKDGKKIKLSSTGDEKGTILPVGASVSGVFSIKYSANLTITFETSSSSNFGYTFPNVSYTQNPDGTLTSTSGGLVGGPTGGGTEPGPGDTGDDGVKIVYHFNDGSADADTAKEKNVADTDYIDNSDGSHTFTLKNPDKVFTSLTSTYESLGTGKITDPDRYFAGWSTNKNATSYLDVEYWASDLSDKNHLLKSGLTLTTSAESTDLYAIWMVHPALVGYTMTETTADFQGYTVHEAPPWHITLAQSSSVNLGDNGTTTSNHAKKYVVLDTGKNDNDSITVVQDKPAGATKTPDLGSKHYSEKTFVAWFNKEANNEKGDPNTNKADNILFAGDTFKFGTTDTIYSLDALWGEIEATDKTVPYTGAKQGLDGATLQITGTDKLTAQHLVDGLKASYAVTVMKDGTQVTDSAWSAGTHEITFDSTGATLVLPQFTDVGTYNYEITVSFTDVDSSEVESTITVKATLIIDPVLQISVTKQIDGTTAWTEGSFTFTEEASSVTLGGSTSVTIQGTDTNKTKSFGNIQFPTTAGGSYTITVSETDSGLPDGLNKAPDQTVTVNTSRDGDKPLTLTADGITGGPNVYTLPLTFNNTHKPGSLTISKSVTNTFEGLTDGPFTIQVTAPGVNGDYAAEGVTGGKVTFTDSAAAFGIVPGASVTISGLPAGTVCTVTELNASDYTVAYNNGAAASGQVTIPAGGTAAVTVTNTRKTGELTVSKSVSSPLASDQTKDFIFTVTLSAAINDTFGDVTFTNGVGSFTLNGTAGSNSKTISGLPAGITYTVTETADSNFTTPSATLSGDITADVEAKAAFTNTRKIGDLAVTKTVNGYAESDAKFTITVTLTDDGVAAAYNENDFTNGVASFDLKANESKTLKVPVGLDYTVSETNVPANFDVTYDAPSGTMGETGAKVTVINTRKTGTLTVTKTVVNGETDKNFTFTVTLTPAVSGEFNGVQFDAAGKATFGLKDGESKEITGLPAGVGYTVTEEEAPGYETTPEKADGTILADATVTAAFTNTRTVFPKLALSVEKQLQNGNANVIDTYSFTVTSEPNTVTISKSELEVKIYSGTTQDSTELTFPAPGTYKVTVSEKNLGQEVAPGVSFATPQTITVTVGDDYKISKIEGPVTAEEIGTDGNAAAKLTIVNRYESGDLVVTKTVKSNGASVGTQRFHFKVDLHNANITTKLDGEGEMQFTNGVAEFYLANGQSMTAHALPNGLTYTVTETPVDGFDTTYTVNDTSGTGTTCSGTMSGNATVTFTNTYTQVGQLTVTKTVTGTGMPEGQSFQFLLTLTDANGAALNGRYGDVTFTNGQFGFALRNGEQKTFTGLPTGTTYKVEETDVPAGYTPTATGDTGKIGDHNAVARADFTNGYRTGDLTITKKVATGGNTRHAFTIDVRSNALAGQTFNTDGPNGAGTLPFNDNGVAIVSLMDGQFVTIHGLPAGVPYTVTERGAAALGYTVTYAGASGTIAAGTNSVTVNNKYQGGSLTVTKKVTGDGADLNKKFKFTVSVDGAVGPRGDVTFGNDNTAAFELSGGESITIPGLPAGAQYTVTEEDVGAQGYTTTSTGSTGMIKLDDEVTAAFTNDYHPGRLIVQKVVSGSGYDPDATYQFRVELVGKTDCTGHDHGQMQFINGVASFTLKAGQSIYADNLYVGTDIRITEQPSDDYETTVGGNPLTGGTYTCNIPDNRTHAVTAVFTNRYKTGGLTVSKTVTGDGADMAKAFNFTVQAADKNGQPVTGTYGAMEFVGGKATFDLNSDDSVTATGLPAGTTFTVTEAEAGQHGYATTVNGVPYPADGYTGTIEDGTTARAAFTNTYESGGLTVTKTVTIQGSQQREFHISVDLSDKTVNGKYGDMEFTDGTAMFTLKHGDSVTATGLPAGTEYTVTERWADDYQTSYEGQSGTIVKGETAQVAVTNHYPGGDLIVSKTVVGAGAEKTKDFHFTVTLSDSGVNGPRGDVSFTDGVASFTLKHGQSVTIPGLREGTTYTVTEAEANQNGYETTVTGAEGDIAESQSAVAAFTNRYCPGQLTVSKTVTGVSTTPEEDPEFSFTLQLDDETFSGTRGGVDFTGGKATFTLKNGERMTFSRLPLGGYTVTEDPMEGYVAEEPVITGELTADALSATAAFVNQTNTGTLEITKTVTGDAGEKDRDFNFSVELTNYTGCEHQHGDVKFHGGKADFTLRDGQKVTITGLPVGVTYIVVEKDADQDGYTITSENAMGEITEAGQTVQVSFKNHKELLPGALYIDNTVIGEGADKNKDFSYTLIVTGITGEHDGVLFDKDNTTEFTLKHGEHKQINGLPDGARVTVTQQAADGYTTSVTTEGPAAPAADSMLTASETIEKGKVTKIHFVNTTVPATATPAPTATATPTPTATATPTPTATATPTPTATATPAPTATATPVTATPAATAPATPRTGDESEPIFWAAVLTLSALGLGAVLTLTRKKRG